MLSIDNVKLYIITLTIFTGIDLIWLRFIFSDFINKNIGHLLKKPLNPYPALLFYALYAAAVVALCLIPAIKVNSPIKGLINGAVLGFTAYAAYDLTNLSTLNGWPVKFAVADILWGTFITGLTAFLSFIVYTKYIG